MSNSREVAAGSETGEMDSDPEETREQSPQLPMRVRLAFSVGHVFNDLCASMWFTYLLVFFHLVLQFDNTLAGVVLFIGQFADGIATPFVGLEVGSSSKTFRGNSDQAAGGFLVFFRRMGPRKSWHLFGTFCILVSFPFIFLPCVGCQTSSQWAQVIYFAAFVVIFQFGWASVQISHLSLIPVLAKDERSRTDLTALRYAFTVASNVTIYVTTWLIFGISGATDRVVGPEDASKFRDVVLIAVGLGGLLSLLFHWGVSESPYQGSANEDGHQSSQASFMRAKDWLKERQFYQIAMLYMTTRLFVNLSQVYLPLWLQDSLSLGATSVATTPLALFISGFLASLFMGWLTKVAGRKVVYSVGACIGLSACILVWFGQGELFKSYGVYGVAALFGAGGSTMLITSLAITADLIGPHVDSGAFVYGAMSFTDKLSNGVAVVLIQYFHPCSGCCPDCRPYYVLILSLVCGGAAVLSLLSLATLINTHIGVQPKGYQRVPSVADDMEDLPTSPEPILNSDIEIVP